MILYYRGNNRDRISIERNAKDTKHFVCQLLIAAIENLEVIGLRIVGYWYNVYRENRERGKAFLAYYES